MIDHTCVNPNQARACSIDIFDDPCDPCRDFGMSVPDRNVFTLFQLKGSSAVFTTRQPSQADLSTLWASQSTLTSKQTWNPHDLKPCWKVSTTMRRIISKVIATDVQALRTGLNQAQWTQPWPEERCLQSLTCQVCGAQTLSQHCLQLLQCCSVVCNFT